MNLQDYMVTMKMEEQLFIYCLLSVFLYLCLCYCIRCTVLSTNVGEIKSI